MDKAKKRLASALDGFRSGPARMDVAVDEKVAPEHCCFQKVVRHGFPDDARCIGYDPVQRLLAIGTGHGTVRVIGDVGVDYLLRHESDSPVNHVQFLINEGGLITACANDMVHLWNFRQKTPEVVHSIQLNKEGVSAIHLPMGSKWLYVGTDKGNIYFVSVATFQMSAYVINWNKAIDLSCRVHPGSVRQLVTCPSNPSLLLITYDKGVAVLWNLVTREVDRFPLDPPIKSVCWHYDGRQVMCGNVDGSICIYTTKKTTEPLQKSTPHGHGACRPVPIIDWKHMNENDQLICFSGGMPTDDGLPVPALTILRASKSATVLEMEHPILSFITLPQVPFASIPQQPHAVCILLKNDLMVVDLSQAASGANGTAPPTVRDKDGREIKYPVMESPHAMDIHESPVSCVQYYSDCPSDLIGALTLVGCKQRKKGYSDKPWPINGGVSRDCATGHQEIVITGHKDGSMRFWQASGEHLQILYRLKAGSHFERQTDVEAGDKVSYAIKSIELCLESRLLLVTGDSGQATLFRFSKTESMNTIAVVNIPSLITSTLAATQDERGTTVPIKEMRRQKKALSRDSTHSPDTSDASGDERIVPFKVRGAAVKRPAGYQRLQPELACLIPWPSQSAPDTITATAINSAFGVIALGTTNGLALVDIAQCVLIYAWSSSELYGSEPTPSIQLSQQHSDAGSPVELDDDAFLDDTRSLDRAGLYLTADHHRAKSPHQHKKSQNSVVGILRRNTAELAATIKERYASGNHPGSAVPDRPDAHNRSPSPSIRLRSAGDEELSPEHRPAGRSQSVKGGLMRMISKKGNSVARSLSFHSHISEEGEAPRSDYLSRPSASETSASSHSLERVDVPESVTSLQFVYSSSRRNDAKAAPCLWVGTSTGASIALNLILPQDRLVSSVVVAPSANSDCTVIRLKGQILYQTFLDQSFCLLGAGTEQWKDNVKDRESSSGSPDKNVCNKVLTKPSLAPNYAGSIDCTEEVQQMLVVAAEQEVKVVALPSFSQMFLHKCEEIPLVKVQSTHIRGFPVLMCLSAAGQIVVLSLPSLRPLHQATLIPHSVDIDDAICQKTAFSEYGLGVYMASPSEMEKYTVCADMAEQTADAMGELFVPCDMPEPPKNNSFLKGVSSFLGGSPRPSEAIDVDAILSDKGEKAALGQAGMRMIARVIPGPSTNMDRAQAGGVSAGQAAAMALQNLSERGEKLNATVDATDQLRNSAMNMANRTGKLVEKYEKKKWYNF